jgi:hypothetical protein
MPSMIDRKCKCCKKDFKARAADVKRGWGFYCSKSCKAKVQEKKNGQYKAYLNGRGVSNLHPERLKYYSNSGMTTTWYEDDTHPFSSEALGQS